MALYEIDIIEGLEDVCKEEIAHVLGVTKFAYEVTGAVGVKLKDKSWKSLHELRRANAIYTVQRFDVPRPKALLGHQNFESIIEQVQNVMGRYGKGVFASLGLDAPGEQSDVMQRIKQSIAEAVGLTMSDEQGDLFIRVRTMNEEHYTGWEVLVRTSPRPLVTRDWRVADYAGALNGVVANAMIGLMGLTDDALLLNIGCGSGSLMIERYHQAGSRPWGMSIGVDMSLDALMLASENIRASKLENVLSLVYADGGAIGLTSASVDALVADLPFGNAIGTHETNIILYPRLLKEGARIAKAGAQFAIITHELALIKRSLADIEAWQIVGSWQINLRGLHPTIYILERQ